MDEIDSHLHPSWQRTIASWFHEAFPSMQFIVATHSPLIPTRITDAEGMVVRLVQRTQGRGKVVDAKTGEGTIGLTADQNLTGPNFGLETTRDVLVDGLIREIQALRTLIRERKAKPRDRRRLEQLELRFEELAPPTSTYGEMQRWRRDAAALRVATKEYDGS